MDADERDPRLSRLCLADQQKVRQGNHQGPRSGPASCIKAVLVTPPPILSRRRDRTAHPWAKQQILAQVAHCCAPGFSSRRSRAPGYRARQMRSHDWSTDHLVKRHLRALARIGFLSALESSLPKLTQSCSRSIDRLWRGPRKPRHPLLRLHVGYAIRPPPDPIRTDQSRGQPPAPGRTPR